ncbi:MAG: 4Fe-4S binding protein [Fibromonadales bacterium]|nr:4Fe-4S binding protein [Fibromonadales bacterium]
MMRKIRIALASLFMIAITALFIDFTGSVHAYLGWCAKIQLVPAILASSGAAVCIILFTLLFGRIYCSVVCPLGIFQDLFSRKKFSYRPPRKALIILRYALLAAFPFTGLLTLLEPYSAYGRIASQLLGPIYLWGNNLLAYFAERMDSYAFYSVEVWLKGGGVLAIAILTFLAVGISAWKTGRGYCNAVCPVGAFLGLLAKFSVVKVRINKEKCTNCGICAKNCKASCIDSSKKEIDYLRCVNCFTCMAVCPKNAVKYKWEESPSQTRQTSQGDVKSRRSFLIGGALLAATAAANQFDGGLMKLESKKSPERSRPIIPPGADNFRSFHNHCTGCQLCTTVCSNQVLRPHKATKPTMSFERGYCRPECVKCSQVCPSGAIRPITAAEKSSIQIGCAVWKSDLCVNDCDLCIRKCPTNAVQRVGSQIVIAEERCIGCGACEHLCPSRPHSAIYVEGFEAHRVV